MASSFRFFYIVFVASSLVPSMGFAQDAGALQQQFRQQFQHLGPQVPAPAQQSIQNKPVGTDEVKIFVKAYRFSGNTLISHDQLNEVVGPWTNVHITFGDLESVIQKIQDLYMRAGRLALAIAPPQDIEDSQILIEINEAKWGTTIVEPAVVDQPLRIQREVVGRYFDRTIDIAQYIETRSVERALSLVNELPGVRAAGVFEQGKAIGETNFRVAIADTPLLSGQAALSNYGSPATGSEQTIAGLNLNNPGGIGDQLTLTGLAARGSTYGQLGYSLPMGYDGWRVGVQGSYLNYETLSGWGANQSRGFASTAGLNLMFPIVRQPDNKLDVGFALESRHYSNSAAGSNISNYQVSALTAGVNGALLQTSQSVVSYSLTGTLGNLTINNATQFAQDSVGPQTSGAYMKLGFKIGKVSELEFLSRTSWLVSLQGQIANKNLSSSEQIYMGGPLAVRAYPSAQGAGSQGAILTNELQHRLDEHLKIGAFVDIGYVQQYVNLYPSWQGLTGAGNNYLLAAVGPTLSFNYDNWSVDGTLAFRIGDNPLYNSSGQQLNTDNAYRSVQAWIQIRYSF